VAFATIAGLPPEYGLYAAMVPAVIGAFFGSSWHLVTGPTTAISLLVFAAVSPLAEPGSAQYISLALTLSFLTGVFQLALGLARMGILVNFISHTVVVGFTAGAAVLIATSQIQNFFDLAMPRGIPFEETILLLFEMIDQINPYATAVGLVTVLCGVLVGKYRPKLPYMILAMVAGSLLALVLDLIVGVEQTSIDTVGALPRSMPPLSIPDLSLSAISSLLFSALAITVLGLTEAVSISRAIAAKTEQHIDTNQEFIGQGLANIVGSFFSSYPASGSFNRSGLNYTSGAQTPLAAALASVLLLLILLAVAPLASYLPIPTMAGVLFLVAYRLIDFHTIRRIISVSKSETMVFSVTLVGTLLDLEKGIFVGMMLSLLLYLYRTSRPLIREALPAPGKAFYHFIPRMGAPGCPQLKMLFLEGAVFFGAVNSVETSLRRYDHDNPDCKHVLILGSGINFIDLAGAEMLAREARRRRRMGGGLYFHRLKESVFQMLKSGGLIDDIGKNNLFPMGPQVIPKLYPRLDSEVCSRCKSRIFDECQDTLPNGEPRNE
jgi:SulP family sulfate permease